jgi:hypothetical protein
MRCRIGANIDVIIPRLGNLATPASTPARLLPKHDFVPVEVRRFTYPELSVIVTMVFTLFIVMLTTP